MGIFEALGVLALLVLTIGFIPAALSLLPRKALGKIGPEQQDYATWLNSLLVNITALILFRRRSVLMVTLLATLILGVGSIWLEVNMNHLQHIPSQERDRTGRRKASSTVSGCGHGSACCERGGRIGHPP